MQIDENHRILEKNHIEMISRQKENDQKLDIASEANNKQRMSKKRK